MKSWLSGIAASVIAGVLIWVITSWPHPPSPTPPPQQPAVQQQAAPPTMGELELHTNRQGSDIADLDMPTAGACAQQCLATTNCKAMTFVIAGSGGVCWLKDNLPPKTFSPVMTSSVKNNPGN